MAPLYFLTSILGGCTYETGVITNEIDIDTTVVVSFSQEIMPLFEEKCGDASCHGIAGVAPILTENVAYEELWQGNYIDTLKPEDSELYQWMISNRALDMPLAGPDWDLNALVLNWITQGAENN